MKKIAKMILFVIIGLLLFTGIQKILVSDANLASQALAVPDLLHKEDINIDVLFLGPSHTANGVSPMQIYESTGIVSCNLGTGKQPLAASYYILRDVSAKHDLKAVVLDASALFYENGGDNTAWRDVLDNMEFGWAKLDFILDYGRWSEGSGLATAVFPILQYHSRWNQLGKNDFYKGKDKSFIISSGVLGKVVGTNVSLNEVEANEKQVHKDMKYTFSVENGNEVIELKEESNLFPEVLSENAMQYLQKTKLFCDEKGIKLILSKIPSMTTYSTMGGSWTASKSEMVKEIAKQNNIIYVDSMYDYDVGINWLEDTGDYGAHLNIRGAVKVSDWYANYLENSQQIEEQNNSFFDEQLAKYQKLKIVAMLQSEQNFEVYLQRLLDGKSKRVILMTVCYDGVGGVTDSDYQMFDRMEQSLIRNAKGGDSYIAVIDAGQLKYEAVSDESISYTSEIDGSDLYIRSSGAVENPGASISIDGTEYAMGSSGLNIVVYDKNTQMVIDSVSFHTYTAGKEAERNYGLEEAFLTKYRQRLQDEAY